MKNNAIGLAVALAMAGLIFIGGKMALTPRGIRNNNPGNIRHGDQWAGMAAAQLDPSFVTFDDPRYGFRAMARILGNYRKRGVETLEDIIATWAPPNENDTGSYIASVSNAIGIAPGDIVSEPRWPDLLAAITYHENGQQPYDMETIREGVSWA